MARTFWPATAHTVRSLGCVRHHDWFSSISTSLTSIIMAGALCHNSSFAVALCAASQCQFLFGEASSTVDYRDQLGHFCFKMSACKPCASGPRPFVLVATSLRAPRGSDQSRLLQQLSCANLFLTVCIGCDTSHVRHLVLTICVCCNCLRVPSWL